MQFMLLKASSILKTQMMFRRMAGLEWFLFIVFFVGLPGFSQNVLYVDRLDDQLVTDCTSAANDCTLRGALTVVQSGQTIYFDPDVFFFDPNLFSSPTKTIVVTSPLPTIDDDQVTITAGGHFTLPHDPLVVIDGSQAGVGTHGLHVTSDGNIFQNFVIKGFDGDGFFFDNAANNIIGGGFAPEDRRFGIIGSIENGGWGVRISGENADNNRFSRTYVGGLPFTELSEFFIEGGNALGGFMIEDGADGTILCDGNSRVAIISNHGPGVVLSGSETTNTIWSTTNDDPGESELFIGMGTSYRNEGPGILVQGAVDALNLNEPGKGMINISNDGSALRVESGERINIFPSEQSTNSMQLSNPTGPVIDLVSSTDPSSGFTENDPGDGDTGPNSLLNYPEIESIDFVGPDIYQVSGQSCAGCTAHLIWGSDDQDFRLFRSFIKSFQADSNGDWQGQVDLSRFSNRRDLALAAISEDQNGNISEVSPSTNCELRGIAPTASRLDFGCVIPGEPATLEVVLRNLNLAAGEILNLALENNSGAFSILQDSGETELSYLGTRTLLVSFDPAGLGQDTATLVVETQIPCHERVEFTIYGEGANQIANKAPVISDVVIPSGAIEGDLLEFEVEAYDLDDTNLTYSWSFGDGSQSTQQNPEYTFHSSGQYTVEVTVSDSSGASDSAQATITVDPATCPQIISTHGAGEYCDIDKIYLAAFASGDNLRYRWLKDGEEIGYVSNVLDFYTAFDYPFSSDLSGSYVCEVSNDCGVVSSVVMDVKIWVNPEITRQPESQIVPPGQDAHFEVEADGLEPLFYQWFKDGNEIMGETSASLTIPNISTADEGLYWVEVRQCGTVESQSVTLGVGTCGEIQTQPQSQSLCSGQPLDLAVEVDGTATAYQWFHNGTLLGGRDESSMRIWRTDVDDAGSYYCEITTPCGVIVSDLANVDITHTATVTSHPQSRTVQTGETVVFNVTAVGAAPISYQWLKEGQAIPNATATQLTLRDISVGDAGLYSVVVTNVCGGESSHSARLDVLDCGQIVTEPQDASLCTGASLSLAVVADGSISGYQWYRNGVALAGATQATLQISDVTPRHAGTYFCRIQAACDDLISRSATVSVARPPSMETQPSSLQVAEGATAIFSAVASGTAPLSYQWHKDNQPITGADGARLMIPAVEASDLGSYHLVVTNGCGQVSSHPADLSLLTSGQPTHRIMQIDRDFCPQVDILTLVTDGEGRPVTGLSAADFALFENGVSRDLSLQSLEGRAAMALALDHSSSLNAAQLAEIVSAVQSWISGMSADDRMALLSFDGSVRLLQSLTSDQSALTAALNSLQTGGRTALYDAVVQAVASLETTSGRRIALVLSDGQDNASRHTREEVLALLRSAGVPLISVGFGRADWAFLEEMASASGGLALRADQLADLPAVLAFLNTMLEGQYLLRYQTDLRDDSTVSLDLQVSVGEATSTQSASYRACPAENATGLLVSAPDLATTLVDGVLNVPIHISNTIGGSVTPFDLTSYQLTLQFPEGLSFAGATGQGTASSGWDIQAAGTTSSVTVSGTGRAIEGHGVLLALQFIPEDPNFSAFCGDLIIQDAQFNGGSIEVNSEDGELCLLPCNPGDINGDGQSDGRDARLLEDYLVGNLEFDSTLMNCRGDLSENGQLSVFDAALIYNPQRNMFRAEAPSLNWSTQGVAQTSPKQWRGQIVPDPASAAPISAQLVFEGASTSGVSLSASSEEGASVVRGQSGNLQEITLIDAGYFGVSAAVDIAQSQSDVITAVFDAADILNRAFGAYQVEEQPFNERVDRMEMSAGMLGHAQADQEDLARTQMHLDTRRQGIQSFVATVHFDPEQLSLIRLIAQEQNSGWSFSVQDLSAGVVQIEGNGPQVEGQIWAPISLEWRTVGQQESTKVQIAELQFQNDSHGLIAGESIVILSPNGINPEIYRLLPQWGSSTNIQELLGQTPK